MPGVNNSGQKQISSSMFQAHSTLGRNFRFEKKKKNCTTKEKKKIPEAKCLRTVFESLISSYPSCADQGRYGLSGSPDTLI